MSWRLLLTVNFLAMSPFLLVGTGAKYELTLNRMRIHGHKIILSARSDYFRGLFAESKRKKGILRRSLTVEFEISNIESTTFFAVLQFLYTGKLNAFGVSLAELRCIAPQTSGLLRLSWVQLNFGT